METSPQPKLFTPVEIGPYTLSHRVVMAPLTRLRSEVPGDVPGDLMVEYYGQRASEGGLMITEATTVSVTARGSLGAPGIYTDDQVQGWRRVTDAVHAKGARLFLQLWHVGRVSHVSMTGGAAPVGPSLVPFEGVAFTKEGWVPVSPYRALDTDEIPGIVEDYRRGAERALAAGFDGVEIHGANGYLVDQFLQDGSNQRTDAYGGSVENRARLLFEIVDGLVSVWGTGRVAVRLSPESRFHNMSDSNPAALFGYVAGKLNAYGLAYLHIIEPRINGSQEIAEGLPPIATEQIRKIYEGRIISAGGFHADTAEAIVEQGDADLVAFGRYFIANPDLPYRLQRGLPLNPYDRATFYGGDAHGYTDYPFFREVPGSQNEQEKNKRIVLDAFDTLFNKRDFVGAEKFWSAGYVQHSATVLPGRDGLFDLIKDLPTTMRYECDLVMAEGDRVMLHGRYTGTGKPANWIAVDIVRMQDGVLVEHWDVIQEEAARAESRSGNPMFGDAFSR